MMMATLIAASVFAIAALYVGRELHKVARDKARFRFYAVRDDLAFLVASGKLSEESPVYKYYFERASRMLDQPKQMGLDTYLRIMVNYHGDQDFDRALKTTKKKMDALLGHPDAQIAEVRGVIADYYDAMIFSLTANTSVRNCILLPLLMANDRAAKLAEKNRVDEQTARSAKVHQFAIEERRQVVSRQPAALAA